MRSRFATLSALLLLACMACKKNEMSKIPLISLNYFGKDIRLVGVDTTLLVLNFEDGDADLGVEMTGDKFDIYINDKRFDTGFTGYYFPKITDDAIKDPTKGMKGKCSFFFSPDLLLPRIDSVHMALGDTTHFEVYIKDAAGNESNHVTTGSVYMVY